MKRLLSLPLVFFLFVTSGLFGQTVEWAYETLGSQTAWPNALAVTQDGYAYTTSSPGFIAKYGLDGDTLWVVRPSVGAATARAIAIDHDGNVVVSGYFSGGFGYQGSSISSNGGADSYVAKFRSDGSLMWIRRIGGQGSVFTYDVKVDGSNNIYLASTVSAFPVQVGSMTITRPASSQDNYVFLKLDQVGMPIWSHVGFCTFTPRFKVSDAGEIFALMEYQHWVHWDGDTIQSEGQADQLLVKFNANGSPAWSNKMTSPWQHLLGNDLELTDDGEVTVLIRNYVNYKINDSIFLNMDFTGWDSLSGVNYMYDLVHFNRDGQFEWRNSIPHYRLDTAQVSDTSEHGLRELLTFHDSTISVMGMYIEKINFDNYYTYAKHGAMRYTLDIRTGAIIDTLLYRGIPMASNVALDSAGNFYEYGTYYSSIEIGDTAFPAAGGWYSAYIAKVSHSSSTTDPPIPISGRFQVLPNPFNEGIRVLVEPSLTLPVTYMLAMVSGEVLLQGEVESYDFVIPTADIASGTYVIWIDDEVFKMVKVRP